MGFSDILDAAEGVERHDNVRIGDLVHPRHPVEFKRTCSFVDQFGVGFRLDADAYYLSHIIGEGVGISERLGGLDYYHSYTLWTRGSWTNSRGNTFKLIYYAESRRDSWDEALYARMLSAEGIDPGLARCQALGRKYATSWPDLAELLRSAKKADDIPYPLNRLVNRIPYFRLAFDKRLFRLFSQDKLMALPFWAFFEYRKRIEEDVCMNKSAQAVAALCFPWLRPNDSHPMLDTEGLLAAQRHYRFDTDAFFGVEAWTSIILCIEFFKKALEQNQRNGHTYASLSMLAHAYIDAVRWEERHRPTAREILRYNMKQEVANEYHNVRRAMESFQRKAIEYKIIKVEVITIDRSKPRAPQNVERVVYSLGDHIMERYVADALNTIATKRWKRERHADACTCEADVLDRIATAKPPKGGVDAPQWHNPAFQQIWKERLDAAQRRAIVNMVLNPISFVVGPPGTGKTELFVAIQALFNRSGLPEDNTTVALAAYGRIAKVLSSRLGDAYTFHRAEATVRYRETSRRAQSLLAMCNVMIDEFGLVTLQHLYRCLSAFGSNKVRFLFAGDVCQMGAIGQGSIVGSIYERFASRADLFTELNVPHRFLPNFGAGLSEDELAALMTRRPEDPSDPMSVYWNMKQMREYESVDGRARLDLVVGCSPTARFCIVPEGSTPTETLENMQKYAGISIDDINGTDVQILTHTNETRRKLNQAFRNLTPNTPHAQHRFRIGEKVTFSINRYLSKEEEEEEEEEEDSDDSDDGEEGGGFGDAALSYFSQRPFDSDVPVSASVGTRAGGNNKKKRGREESSSSAAGPPAAKKQRIRDGSWRGIDSDNVFNGDVKQIAGVYEVTESGNVRTAYGDMQEALQRRGMKHKSQEAIVVSFDDGTQINLSTYDSQEMDSALVLTATKFQGSEVRRAVYYHAPSPHIRRDQLYTCKTRGIDQFVWIGGPTKREALSRIEDIVAAEPPKRREQFGWLLDLQPLVENPDATTS